MHSKVSFIWNALNQIRKQPLAKYVTSTLQTSVYKFYMFKNHFTWYFFFCYYSYNCEYLWKWVTVSVACWPPEPSLTSCQPEVYTVIKKGSFTVYEALPPTSLLHHHNNPVGHMWWMFVISACPASQGPSCPGENPDIQWMKKGSRLSREI